jgi:hypothetical protein
MLYDSDEGGKLRSASEGYSDEEDIEKFISNVTKKPL